MVVVQIELMSLWQAINQVPIIPGVTAAFLNLCFPAPSTSPKPLSCSSPAQVLVPCMKK